MPVMVFFFSFAGFIIDIYSLRVHVRGTMQTHLGDKFSRDWRVHMDTPQRFAPRAVKERVSSSTRTS